MTDDRILRLQKLIGRPSFQMPSFQTPSFQTPSFLTSSVDTAATAATGIIGNTTYTAKIFMYISYVLIGIVLLIIIGLFLQSIGINIIQYRAGGTGFLPLPGSFDSRLIANKIEDISGLLIIDNTQFTVSVNFTVDKPVTINKPEVILFYGTDANLGSVNAPIIGGVNDPVPHWSNGSDISSLFINYLFAVWIDSANSFDLIVQIKTMTPGTAATPSVSVPNVFRLENPSIGVPIILTLVFNKTYAEIYLNGKLTKTFVATPNSFPNIIGNGNVYTSSSGALYNSKGLSPDVTVNKVIVWNTVLTTNEIYAIT